MKNVLSVSNLIKFMAVALKIGNDPRHDIQKWFERSLLDQEPFS